MRSLGRNGGGGGGYGDDDTPKCQNNAHLSIDHADSLSELVRLAPQRHGGQVGVRGRDLDTDVRLAQNLRNRRPARADHVLVLRLGQRDGQRLRFTMLKYGVILHF